MLCPGVLWSLSTSVPTELESSRTQITPRVCRLSISRFRDLIPFSVAKFFTCLSKLSTFFCSRLETMFTEQEQTLPKGHELPEAILRNVLSAYEELSVLEQSDRRKHHHNVMRDYQKVSCHLHLLAAFLVPVSRFCCCCCAPRKLRKIDPSVCTFPAKRYFCACRHLQDSSLKWTVQSGNMTLREVSSWDGSTKKSRLQFKFWRYNANHIQYFPTLNNSMILPPFSF